jgi:hypothetical protein
MRKTTVALATVFVVTTTTASFCETAAEEKGRNASTCRNLEQRHEAAVTDRNQARSGSARHKRAAKAVEDLSREMDKQGC